MNEISADVQQAGMEAVFSQDEERLKDALARGFRLNEFQRMSRAARKDPSARSEAPVSPFLRTIALNWYPGWQLLVNAFPDHIHRPGATGFPLLWETALQKARRAMLQDMALLGVDPLVRDVRHRSSIHVLFEGVRSDALERPSAVDLMLCAKWLAGKGVDVFEPHPGDYHPNDIYKEGHTLWSYAITQDAWHVALAMMPRRWDDVVRTPRWRATLDYFRQRCASGRVQAEIAYQVWGQFLSRFLDDWLRETGDLLTDEAALPWVTRLSVEARARLWPRWAQPDGTGRMAWHRVAQHAHLPEHAVLLHLAQVEGVNLLDVWTQAEKYGERPMDAWAYALAGRSTPLPADAWAVHHAVWKALPADACALTDAIHDPSVNALLTELTKTWSKASPRHRVIHETDALRAYLAAFQLGAGTASEDRRRL